MFWVLSLITFGRAALLLLRSRTPSVCHDALSPRQRPCRPDPRHFLCLPKGPRPLRRRARLATRSSGPRSSRWPWGPRVLLCSHRPKAAFGTRSSSTWPTSPAASRSTSSGPTAWRSRVPRTPCRALGDLGRRGAAVRLASPSVFAFRPSRVVGPTPARALWGIAGVASLYWLFSRLIDRRAGIYGSGRALHDAALLHAGPHDAGGHRGHGVDLDGLRRARHRHFRSTEQRARPHARLGARRGWARCRGSCRGARSSAWPSRRSSVGLVLDDVVGDRAAQAERSSARSRAELRFWLASWRPAWASRRSRGQPRPSIRCGSERRYRDPVQIPYLRSGHSLPRTFALSVECLHSLRGGASLPRLRLGRASQQTIPRCGPVRHAYSASSARRSHSLPTRRSRPRSDTSRSVRRRCSLRWPRFRIRDFERGAPASRALGVGVAVLCALYLRDYIMFPEKGLSAFAVSPATFPDSFKDRASTLILVSCGIFSILVFFSWLEEQVRPCFTARRLPGVARIARTRLARQLVSRAGGSRGRADSGRARSVVVAPHLSRQAGKPAGVVGARHRAQRVLDPAAGIALRWCGCRWWGAMRSAVFRQDRRSRGAWPPWPRVSWWAGFSASSTTRRSQRSSRRKRSSSRTSGCTRAASRSAYSASAENRPRTTRAATSKLSPTCRAPSPGSRAAPERRWMAVRNEDLAAAQLALPLASRPEAEPPGARRALEPDHAGLEPARSRASGTRARTRTSCSITSRRSAIAVEVNLQDQLLSLGWDVTDDAGSRVDCVVPGQEVPLPPLLQGPRADFGRVGDLHPHRRLPAPVQRRPQDARRQVPVQPLADRRLHRRRLRVLARAELHAGQLQRLLRPFRRRDPHQGEDRRATRTTASTAASSTSLTRIPYTCPYTMGPMVHA